MLFDTLAPATIFDIVDLPGQFWLPTNPGRRVGGALHLRPGELIGLDVFGSLEATDPLSGSGGMDYPVIHGVTTQGMACTVLEASQSRSVLTGYGTTGIVFHAAYALIGLHADTLDAARFLSGQATFTGLAGWAGQAVFREIAGGGAEPVLSATATYPPGFALDIPALDARITLAGALTSAPNALEAVTWTYEPYLRVEPRVSQPLTWFLKVLDDLRNLLVLCTFSTVAAEKVSVFPDSRGYEAGAVYRSTWLDKRPEPVAPPRMIVRLPFILPSIEMIVREWLALVEVARPSIDLFCGALFRGAGISTFSFLALAQAAEGYHRCVFDGIYEPVGEYARHEELMVTALPSDLPEPLRARLRKTLQHANEFSFRRRLRELFDALGPLQSVVCSDPTAVVGEIVDARNMLTHQLKDGPRPKWPRLAYLSRVLQLLFLATVLRRLAVPDSVIQEGLGTLAFSLRFINQP